MSEAEPRPTPEIPLTDPSALTRFGRIEVVARLIVEGCMMGQHKSPIKGSSIEFVEHRQYYPGDEIRHIDWRAYGRTSKYYIKEFEDEINLRCYLLLDCSASMSYAASTISKFEYARLLTASLSYLLLSQRDAAGLITFDREIRHRIEPTAAQAAFRRITDVLEQCEPGEKTGMVDVLAAILPTLERRSLIVVLSDCFDRLSDLTTVLKRFRLARHEMVLFQIVAPEEQTFPFTKPTQFHNLEDSGDRVLVDPHRLREHYLIRYQAFCEELANLCNSTGVDHQKLVTSEPWDRALGAWLNLRASGRKKKYGPLPEGRR